MTPTLLLQFFAILAGGACFVAFLLVILILAYKLISNNSSEYYEEIEGSDGITEEKLTKQQTDIYVNGVMRGSSIVFVSIFQTWKDNNEVPLIGNFDELRIEFGKNLELFNKDNKLMNDWVDKYNEHFKKTQEDK